MQFIHILFTLVLVASAPLASFSFFGNKQHPITIMLDPAGDARHVGRKLDDAFERGIALQCAERLKAAIEQNYPHVRVVLTRLPGEIEQPLQHANFANRLNTDLYISLHFYQEHDTKPHWYIYTFSYGNDFVIPSSSLTFYTYDNVHRINTQVTQRWATMIKQTLNQEPYTQHFICTHVYKLPFKPLIGIKAPAIAYEIGLKKQQDWTHAIEPVVASLAPLIKECQSR